MNMEIFIVTSILCLIPSWIACIALESYIDFCNVTKVHPFTGKRLMASIPLLLFSLEYIVVLTCILGPYRLACRFIRWTARKAGE